MPRFRSDLENIVAYRPGTSIEQAARRLGLERIVKLASNESPAPPFPEVQEAIAAATGDLNRYPDNDADELREAVAKHLSVPTDRLWFGAGSSPLMMTAALAVGGPGTSALYAWPSFGLYRIATRVALAEEIEVPLDRHHVHDLDTMHEAIRSDTTVVYVCNPNNPTGTHVDAKSLFGFIDSVPRDVLIVIDEAYFEYVPAPEYSSALPLALERDNVLVARTFSKVYGLAGLRVGYMVGDPGVIAELRRIQVPFSVNALAQTAATEALRHQDQAAERVRRNADAVKLFQEELTARSYEHSRSVTNFVYLHPGDRSDDFFASMTRHGIVVRKWSEGWVRITVGSDSENALFFAALEDVGYP